MMPRGLWPAVALLALGGCYAPSPNAEYGNQPAYPTSGYPSPEYPPGVYPPAPYDPNVAAYPGYGTNGGAPTIIQEGAPVPLVLFGGEWGFYDHERHWRRAPDDVRRRFEEHEDGRRHFEEHRDAGPQFRPDRPRFGEGYGQPRPDGRPAPFGERPGVFPGFRPTEQARPVAPAAAPAPPAPLGVPASVSPGLRPSAPPAAPPRPESHDRRQNCPPGQRC